MYTIKFIVTNEWSQGFTAEMVITNGGTTPLTEWQLRFDAPFKITNLWSANLQSDTGDGYVISNAAWNGVIAPEESISLGFNGLKAEGMVFAPTNFSLNGIDLDGDSSPPAELVPPVEPDPPAEPVVPNVAVTDTQVAESGKAIFTLSLSESSSEPVTVDVATRDGSATAGSDYVAISNSLTFAPGETDKAIAVEILADDLVEPDETFELQLLEAVNAQISVLSATAIIQNDDVAAPSSPPSPASPHPLVASSPDISFQVNNDWGSGFTATITLSNSGSTAIENWSLAFDAPFTIQKLWSAALVEAEAGSFEVASLDWNQTIAPGSSVTFGFQGVRTSGGALDPTNYHLTADTLNSPTSAPAPPSRTRTNPDPRSKPNLRR